MAMWSLFTLYDKDERDDLLPQQRKTLKAMLKAELGQEKVVGPHVQSSRLMGATILAESDDLPFQIW